jgi:bacteriorhodopsin
MLHPLLRLALARPDLLANHASAYAELAVDNVREVLSDWQWRVVGWALLAAGVLLCIVFGGMALLLYGAVTAPPTPWLLWVVPLAPLLLALWGAWLARRPAAPRSGHSVAKQFETDLSLLRARG